MGVVSEVQKIAQKYMDLDKRVKKLETQVKHKANASDLTDLRKTFLEELDDKVTAEDLKNMQSVINESTKKIVTDTQAVMTKKTETDIKNAITELQQTIPSEDRIKQLIHEETSAATPIQPAEPIANANTREMVDISNRRNNVVVYRLPEQKDSAYKSQGEQRNQKDTTEASQIAITVLDNPPPDSIVKCTRLGKAMPEKDRPLLVTFKDTNIKENFMSNLKNLKGTTYQDISVAHDLTKNQRSELQRMRAEARTKQQQDSGNWVYRVVGHPSMWTIKRLKRKTPPHPGPPGAQSDAHKEPQTRAETTTEVDPQSQTEMPPSQGGSKAQS